MTDVRTITSDDLQQRLNHGGNLEFWNVQTDKWFNGEMIPGSRRMPLDTIEHDTVGIPKNAEIIAVCGGPQCPQSTQAAQKLGELGYTNVRTSRTVSQGWKAAGHAIDKLQEPVPAA